MDEDIEISEGVIPFQDFLYLFYLLYKMNYIRGAMRLQKLVYLCQHRDVPLKYTFDQYFYGPYSEELSHDLSRFYELGFIEIKSSLADRVSATGKPRRVFEYKLTKKGSGLLDENFRKIRDYTKNIDNVVKEYGTQSLENLVNASKKVAGLPIESSLEYFKSTPLKLGNTDLPTHEILRRLLSES